MELLKLIVILPYMFVRYWVMVFVFLFQSLTGCGQDLPLTHLPLTLNVSAPSSVGQTPQQVITASDPLYQKLQELVFEDAKGWRVDVFSPSLNYSFSSKDIDIQCENNSIILNATVNGLPVSLYKKVPNALGRLGLPAIESVQKNKKE